VDDGGQFASARGKGEGGQFAMLAMSKPSKGNGCRCTQQEQRRAIHCTGDYSVKAFLQIDVY
jgi:hypothetical protein